MNNEILLGKINDIARKIENNSLTDKEREHLYGFFLELEAKEDFENNKNYSQGDMIKFLSLGWYIYTKLLNE